MPRRPRACPGGYVYHVLNRAVGRATLFRKDADYHAFERTLIQTCDRFPSVQLFAYCLMRNHWHLQLRPRADGELSEFMRLLTVTHTQRWHAHHRTAGTGPLYQGRFKSFPVQTDEHFLILARYIERNPLRAKLVEEGDPLAWQWSSLWARRQAAEELRAVLATWPKQGGASKVGPGGEPAHWLTLVRRPQTEKELEAVRQSVRRGRPLGSDKWVAQAAAKMHLESTLRPRGRPRKTGDDQK